MSHYAIELKYNFHQDTPGGEIREYFIPFSLRELMSFELNNYTRTAINRLKFSSNYPLDNYVKVNNLEELDYIVLLDDDEIEEIENQRLGIVKRDEISYTFSLWDLLSDANLVFKTSQSYLNAENDIEQLAATTINSQYELLAIKVQLSLLMHFEYEKYFQMPDYSTERSNQGVDIGNIHDLIFFCEEVEYILETNMIESSFIERWLNVEDTFGTDRYKIIKYIKDICKLLEINNNLENESFQRQSNWTTIRIYNDAILKTLWKPFNKAYYYDCVVKAILDNSQSVNRSKTRASFYRFLTKETVFWDEDTTTISWMNASIPKFLSNTVAICTDNYNQMYFWGTFSDYFGSEIATRKIRENYSGEGSSCFSLLFTDSDKHYFSLSGMTEELKPGAGKLGIPVKYIMEHILNKVPVDDIFAHKYKFNFAYIHQNLDVRRYTEIVNDKTDYIDQPGPYLVNGYETYDVDYSKNPSQYYNHTYSCCERKMLAYAGYDHARRIFSRWAPCWKCCPAILDAPYVEVYAFTTLANREIANMKLKRYDVKRNISYSVYEY